METITNAINNNMIIVFFIYGLAWFVMGLAVFLVTKRGLGFRMAESLPWLAGFGIVHGFIEWLDMIKLAYALDSAQASNELFFTLKTLLLGLSLVFLVQFGAHLLASTHERLRWMKYLSPVLFASWLIVSLLFPMVVQGLAVHAPTSAATCLHCHSAVPEAAFATTTRVQLSWFPSAGNLSRYILYGPGLILSAIALWGQAPDLESMNLRGAARNAKLAAMVLLLMLPFAALVVSPAAYFPADILNYETFEGLFGMPTQVFRAVFAVVFTALIIPVMRVFDIEHRRQLNTSREELSNLNQALEGRVEERTRNMTALVDAAKTLNAILDFKELMARVMDEVGKSMGPKTIGVLYLYDEETKQLVERSRYGISEKLGSGFSIKRSESSLWRAFESKQTWVSQDVEEIAADFGNVRLEDGSVFDYRSEDIPLPTEVIGAPLVSRGHAIGALFIASYREANGLPVSLIEGMAEQVALAIDNTRLYEETTRLSATDALTGLWNRRTMEQRLRTEISRHQRSGQSLSLLVVDVDKLKLFNDTYGHMVGDEVLLTVSSALKNSCRDMDEVGRQGGDEFVVILPEANSEEALMVAGRILERLGETPFKSPDGDSVPISVSIGTATYPDDAQDADALFSRSDAAMYRIKLEGGAAYSSTIDPTGQQSAASQPTSKAIQELLTTVDAKDRYTFRHSQDVTSNAMRLAKAMELSETQVEVLELAGQLHDIGKIGVPTEILRKPGKLTSEEYDYMKQHSQLGHAILQQLPQQLAVLEAVLHHHERWDGNGYPNGLKKEEIPLLARILAVVDSYSAMRADRPYRKGLSEEKALQELEQNAGSQFDPKVAKAFMAILEPVS